MFFLLKNSKKNSTKKRRLAMGFCSFLFFFSIILATTSDAPDFQCEMPENWDKKIISPKDWLITQPCCTESIRVEWRETRCWLQSKFCVYRRMNEECSFCVSFPISKKEFYPSLSLLVPKKKRQIPLWLYHFLSQ